MAHARLPRFPSRWIIYLSLSVPGVNLWMFRYLNKNSMMGKKISVVIQRVRTGSNGPSNGTDASSEFFHFQNALPVPVHAINVQYILSLDREAELRVSNVHALSGTCQQ